MCLIFPGLSGIIKYKLLLYWIEVQFTRHLHLDSLFSFTLASKGVFKQLMNYGFYYYHLFQTAPFFSFLSAHFLQWYFSFLCGSVVLAEEMQSRDELLFSLSLSSREASCDFLY